MSKMHGRYEDMGDVVIHTEWLTKGRHWGLVFHIGAPEVIPLSERPTPGINNPFSSITPGRIDVYMDLKDDQKVALSTTFTDEVGNAVPAPDGTAITWSVDNSAVLALVTNSDGTAEAQATGVLGNAVVSVQVDFPNGTSTTGDLLISVVADVASRVAVVAGTPEPITPAAPVPAPATTTTAAPADTTTAAPADTTTAPAATDTTAAAPADTTTTTDPSATPAA